MSTRAVLVSSLCVVILLSAMDGAFAGVIRFAMVADSRTHTNTTIGVNVEVLGPLITDMNAHNPAFCLFPGDTVYGYRTDNEVLKTQLQTWIDTTSHFVGTMYVTPGNHEVNSPGNLNAWREMFPGMPQNGPAGEEGVSYYFDYGNSRFISINADWEDRVESYNVPWLDQLLDDSVGFDHVFVYSHHPVAHSGPLWQTLLSHETAAYFCGHNHYYKATQPSLPDTTWQLIVATAGAPPMDGGMYGDYGYLIVDVDGAFVEATFYADLDDDGHYDDAFHSFVISVPEPATLGLVMVGGLALLRRKRST